MRYLVYDKGGGVKNFSKRTDANMFKKVAEFAGLKGVGVEKVHVKYKLDNTIGIPRLRTYISKLRKVI